jgi:hypothetical protein
MQYPEDEAFDDAVQKVSRKLLINKIQRDGFFLISCAYFSFVLAGNFEDRDTERRKYKI